MADRKGISYLRTLRGKTEVRTPADEAVHDRRQPRGARGRRRRHRRLRHHRRPGGRGGRAARGRGRQRPRHRLLLDQADRRRGHRAPPPASAARSSPSRTTGPRAASATPCSTRWPRPTTAPPVDQARRPRHADARASPTSCCTRPASTPRRSPARPSRSRRPAARPRPKLRRRGCRERASGRPCRVSPSAIDARRLRHASLRHDGAHRRSVGRSATLQPFPTNSVDFVLICPPPMRTDLHQHLLPEAADRRAGAPFGGPSVSPPATLRLELAGEPPQRARRRRPRSRRPRRRGRARRHRPHRRRRSRPRSGSRRSRPTRPSRCSTRSTTASSSSAARSSCGAPRSTRGADVDALLDAGARGITLPAAALAPPRPGGRPLLDRLEARDAPLFVHPGPALVRRRRRPAWWPAMTDYVARDERGLARVGGVGAPAHPRLRVVFAMLAGGAPLHAERLAARGGPAERDPRPARLVRQLVLRRAHPRRDAAAGRRRPAACTAPTVRSSRPPGRARSATPSSTP